jgi:hypothetical protein
MYLSGGVCSILLTQVHCPACGGGEEEEEKRQWADNSHFRAL